MSEKSPNAHFLSLKKKELEEIKEIKSLAISYKFDMLSVMKQLVRCVNLERLSFFPKVSVEWLDEFFLLKKLTYLRVHNLRNAKVFLENVGRLDKLETLSLNQAKFGTKKGAASWADVGRQGFFDKGKKKTTIWNLPHLHTLFLNNCSLKFIPDEIKQLSKLKHLDIRWNKFNTFPTALLKIPHLQELYTDLEILEYPTSEVEDFLDQIPYYFQHQAEETKYISDCLLFFPKYSIKGDLRILAMQLLADNEQKLESIQSLSLLLKATQIPHFDIIRIRATQYLAKYYGQKAIEYLGKEKPVISFCGNIFTNKNVLRKRLKEVGIGYKSSIHETTTHIVIGQSYKKDIQELNNPKYHFLTEYQLNDYLDKIAPQYLVADDSTTDQLRQLLLANDETSIELAFELIKSGGLPKNCITELFICWISLYQGKLFNKAQKWLRQAGSPQFGDLVKGYVGGLFNAGSKYQPNEEYQYQILCSLEQYEELNVMRIAWYTYRQYKVGVQYLINHIEGAELVTFLKEYCEGTSIDLRGLELKEIPKELFELDFLTSINLHHNKLSTNDIMEFYKFPNLKELILTHNRGILKKDRPNIQKELVNCKIKFIE